MVKVLLFEDRIFMNARSFYEYIMNEEEAPNNWNLAYVAVAFTNKLNTISGIEVDWITISDEDYEALKLAEAGWITWKKGPDLSFIEYVRALNISYTREALWRLVVDYAVTFDTPRSHMKRYVEEVMKESEPIKKVAGVFVYELRS